MGGMVDGYGWSGLGSQEVSTKSGIKSAHYNFHNSPQMCLWQESKQYLAEFIHMRMRRLMVECDLESVKLVHVHKLGNYYRAQLNWALALLLEPRVRLFRDGLPAAKMQFRCHFYTVGKTASKLQCKLLIMMLTSFFR